jgi:hypothetical protein
MGAAELSQLGRFSVVALARPDLPTRPRSADSCGAAELASNAPLPQRTSRQLLPITPGVGSGDAGPVFISRWSTAPPTSSVVISRSSTTPTAACAPLSVVDNADDDLGALSRVESTEGALCAPFSVVESCGPGLRAPLSVVDYGRSRYRSRASLTASKLPTRSVIDNADSGPGAHPSASIPSPPWTLPLTRSVGGGECDLISAS